MVAYSQNGFTANDRSVIASHTVPGTNRKIALRKGDTSVILLDIMAWIHAHIEPIDTGIFDDWGYAERTIRGSTTTLSNHASGTAVDANATQHPLGVRGTWTADERRRINARLALYDGCVRWGDNYSGRVDGMHFEIDRGAAACRAVADRIRAGRLGGTPAPSTPAAPPPKKVKPVIIRESLRHGKNYLRLPGMVGTASGLYGRAWLSVSAIGGGTVTNLFQRNTPRDGAPDGVAGERWNNARIRNGSRVWLPVPSGTEFIELWVDVLGADVADPDGPGGFACVEFEPK